MSKQLSAALAAVSVALAAAAEALDEAANAFLAGSESGEESGGRGKAAKSPVRAGSPAKVAAGKKPAPKADDDAPDEDTVREKMKELVDAKGGDALVEAFAEVGAAKLADVDESQYQELMDVADRMIAEEDAEEPDEPPAKKAPAKKVAAKKTAKKAAVTLEDLQEAARAVPKADRTKVYKKLGIASVDELEEDDYDAALAALKAAAPEDDDTV